jgi:hypothetical protein
VSGAARGGGASPSTRPCRGEGARQRRRRPRNLTCRAALHCVATRCRKEVRVCPSNAVQSGDSCVLQNGTRCGAARRGAARRGGGAGVASRCGERPALTFEAFAWPAAAAVATFHPPSPPTPPAAQSPSPIPPASPGQSNKVPAVMKTVVEAPNFVCPPGCGAVEAPGKCICDAGGPIACPPLTKECNLKSGGRCGGVGGVDALPPPLTCARAHPSSKGLTRPPLGSPLTPPPLRPRTPPSPLPPPGCAPPSPTCWALTPACSLTLHARSCRPSTAPSACPPAARPAARRASRRPRRARPRGRRRRCRRAARAALTTAATARSWAAASDGAAAVC